MLLFINLSCWRMSAINFELIIIILSVAHACDARQSDYMATMLSVTFSRPTSQHPLGRRRVKIKSAIFPPFYKWFQLVKIHAYRLMMYSLGFTLTRTNFLKLTSLVQSGFRFVCVTAGAATLTPMTSAAANIRSLWLVCASIWPNQLNTAVVNRLMRVAVVAECWRMFVSTVWSSDK